jgi:CheY-like chemotaxis protein/signal transduction histidine kinase
METRFAPAERENIQQVKQENFQVTDTLEMFKSIVDLMPLNFVVVNESRQIVYCNRSVMGMLQCDIKQILGKRPGELFQCVHSNEMEAGCGTAEACSNCGAINAVLKALEGNEALQESRIRLKDGQTLNLKVWALPVHVKSRIFAVVILFDISNEKMRQALERIFFHDVLNTAGGIHGFTRKLSHSYLEETPENGKEIAATLNKLISRLIGEIKEQKQLLAAEQEELNTRMDTIESLELLNDISILYKDHDIAENKLIAIGRQSESFIFRCDQILLHRILSNMLKNALEASKEGDIVTMGSSIEEETIRFSVHNPTFIPPHVSQQIFQRSYSTKGKGRGLGTYSMKLLSQRYLKGDVSFTTSEEDGTEFYATFPYEPGEEKTEEVEYNVLTKRKNSPPEGRILIVDDNDINCEIVQYILDEQDYKTDIAESAEKALEMMKKNSFRIVLMDMHMPGMAGDEAFRIIRSKQEYDHIPVIAMTADEPSGKDLPHFGMDDSIGKPIGDQIFKVVEKWMRRK